MTKVRRLLAVGAVLALATLITLTQVWGEPARDPDGRLKLGVSPPPDKGGLAFGENLVANKFAEQLLVTYRTQKGETLFALQAQAKVEPPPARPRDLLILIDTSASQAQGPLNASCLIAEAVIQAGQRDDRFAVWTVNTAAKDLTGGFKKKDEAQDAVKVLKKEYPAGATNLKKALSDACAKFDRRADRQRLILFLGDGLSILDPIQPEDRSQLCAKLAELEVAFFPIPLGSRLDPQNLHGLASGTGGTAIRPSVLDQPGDVAKKVYDTVAVPIIYPTKFQLPKEVVEHYPQKLPPLRADAPTLVVGKLKEPGAKLTYTIEGLAAGKVIKVERTEDVPAGEGDPDNFFLVNMVNQWKNAPAEPALLRADRALAFALEQNQLARADLLAQGRWALGEKNIDAAWRLFDQARQLDPNDVEARAGLNVIDKLRKGEITLEQLHKQFGPKADDKIKRIGKQAGDGRARLLALAEQEEKQPAKPDAKQPGTGPDTRLLQEEKQRQAIEDQRTAQLVDDAIRQASRLVQTDPQGANDLLKRTLDGVRANEAISPEARRNLANRLERALQNNRIIGERVQRDLEIRLQMLTAARERALVEEQRVAAEDRIRERMRVFDRLMDQAREEEAARQAQEIRADLLAHGQAVPVAVTGGYQVALNAHNLREVQELVRVRREKFLATLMQVERSAIPFPDEPPVQFPPTPIWEEITRLRKDKYESSGFGGDMPATTRALRDKLASPVTFGGFEKDERLKLTEALDQLSELYDITFEVNETAFAAEVPPLKEVLNMPVVDKAPLPKMRGVSLATVLRKLLTRIPTTSGATFIVRRDTIEITTGQAAAAEKTPRAYPVADLVIPIPNAFNTQSILNQATIFGFAGAAGFGGGLGGFGFPAAGFGGFGFPAAGFGGFGFPAAGIGGLGGFGAFGFPAAGIAGFGGFPAAGIAGNLGALGIAGGGLGGFGAGFGGAANLGFAGGGVNLGVGGGFIGFGGGALGQFGNLGGQFGLQGGDQSVLLIVLIQQVVGTPRDWAPLNPFAQFQLPGVPGGPPGGQDPNANPEGNSIGFFPPAMALVVKGTSKIHMRVHSPINDPRAQPPPPLLPNRGRPDNGDRFAKNDPLRDLNNRVLGDGGKRGDEAKKDPKAATPPVDLDPKKIWQDALSRAVAEPGLIIACTDFLMQCGKYEHVVEFLKANLRQGIVVRPWVYEALAIALRESNASAEEVERAEVSVADLEPQDPQALLRSAQAVAENKRFDRALAFCRQAATLEPNAPQVYADAVVYADLAKDPAAMEWAAGRLMSQDWPVNNAELQRKAKDRMQELAKKLRDANRRPEAERMVAALSQRRERDLVIHLKWQGECDLDLRVHEPTGSVCSCLNRQTVGGGTLLGDSITDNRAETYVAAEAFPGEYKLVIDRVWGQPVGGKAQVEIIEHQDTPKERRRLVSVDLKAGNTLTVQLAEGRRQEVASVPPPALQRPESPTERLEASVSIMAQLRDLAAPVDLGMSPGIRGGAGSPVLEPPREPNKSRDRKDEPTTYQTRVSPFVTNSANLTVQAAVSADRRYVRLSLAPMFNTVTGVRNVPVITTPIIPGLPRP
jgi:tetratricopeptide (TPR) repeat protein